MGKPGFPISPPARVWEGEALEHGAGETWFPHTPAGGRVWEGKALEQAAWGNQVSPRPRWREGLALKQGEGETRFPPPPPGERVWEGCALQGIGTNMRGNREHPHTSTPPHPRITHPHREDHTLCQARLRVVSPTRGD